MSGVFCAISVLYIYGSVVSLDNTYLHLHALSRLVGTSCTRKWRFNLTLGGPEFLFIHKRPKCVI